MLKKVENISVKHGIKPITNFFHNFVPGMLLANRIIENRRLNKEKSFGKDQYERQDRAKTNDGDERE